MHPRSTRRRLLVVPLLVALLALAACGSDSDGGSASKGDAPADAPKVVASTSWVGAVAKLAGATDIEVIAPSNIQHPPDYEPTASDLAALSKADYILLAGFEGFAGRLKEAAGSDAEVLTVVTDYDPAKLAKEAAKLARKWGTEKEAAKNVAAYRKEYEAASKDLQARTKDKPQTIVAQAFVANWAGFAGYDVAGTYGPEPTTPKQVADLAAKKPTLIFENVHMGGGTEVGAAADAELVNLVNFPGDDLELMPVVDKNVELITAAIDG